METRKWKPFTDSARNQVDGLFSNALLERVFLDAESLATFKAD